MGILSDLWGFTVDRAVWGLLRLQPRCALRPEGAARIALLPVPASQTQSALSDRQGRRWFPEPRVFGFVQTIRREWVEKAPSSPDRSSKSPSVPVVGAPDGRGGPARGKAARPSRRCPPKGGA